MDVPTDGDGRIGVPLVAGGQTGGSIGTDRGGEHVPVVVGVHDTAHVGDQARLRVAAAVHGDVGSHGAADVVVLEEFVGDVLSGEGLAGRGGLLGGIQGDGVHTVLAEDTVIGKQVLHGPVERVVEGPGSAVGVGGGSVHAHAGEGTALGVAVVQTEAGLVGETLDPGEVELHIAGVVGGDGLGLVHPDTLGGQILDALARNNILVIVGGHVDAPLEIAVRIVGNHERGLGKGGVHVHLVTGVGGIAGVGGETDPEPLADPLVHAGVQRDAVVTLGRDDGLVIIIGNAEAVAAALGAAGHVQVVVLRVAIAVEEVLPIGELVVGLVQGIAVLTAHLTHLDVLLARHHRILDGLLEGGVGVEGHLRSLALDTLVGGDEDDTVGAAGTVDGGGGGVLEDVHALDVTRGDVGEGSHERHAVEDDERVVGGGQGTLAADADLHRGTRLGVRLGHLDTGDAAFEGAGDITGGNRAEVITAHGGDGAGHILAAGRTVTDHDRGFQLLGVIFEDDVDLAAGLDGNLHGGVAHAGNLEGRGRAGLEGIRTIDTGDGAVGRIHDHHSRSRDGRTALVRDRAADADALRLGEERQHQADSHECKRFLKVESHSEKRFKVDCLVGLLAFLQMYHLYNRLKPCDVTIVVVFEPWRLRDKKNLYFCNR